MRTYSQLSLLDDFDKYERRDEKLVNELVQAIANFKFLRTNVRYTEFSKRAEIEEMLTQILYWMAWVAWKKAKYVPQYKDDHKLDRFLALTKEASDIYVTESLTPETMAEFFKRAHIRTKTTFMAYKDILQAENTATRRILSYFDTIHNLTYD